MTRVGGIAQDQLRSIVERIERLEEEKKALGDDIKEVYAEAKANGFDVKTLRQVVKLRKMDTAERQEAEALLDLYLHALGTTPIEQAIADSADEQASATRVAKAVADPKVRAAARRVGKAVPLTEDEKAKGAVGAFEQRDGTRMSIILPERAKDAKPHSPAAEFASDLAGGARE